MRNMESPSYRLTRLAVAAALSVLPQLSAAQPAPPPNVLVILADDMGIGDVSALNAKSLWQTPNIDRLAREGMVFTDAHSSSSVCTPTRYTLLTGRYSWRGALKRGTLQGYSPSLLERGRLTLPGFLRTQGYATAMFGKWHLGLDWAKQGPRQEDIDYSGPVGGGPVAHGFDRFFGISASLDMPPYVWLENNRVTAPPAGLVNDNPAPRLWRAGPIGGDFRMEDVQPRLTGKTIAYLAERGAARDAKPFFLYLALAAPHTPTLATKAFAGTTPTPYGDFVRQVDADVGTILAALEEHGLARNTLVIFTSDNGYAPAGNIPDHRGLGHDSTGGYRGSKSDSFEGGHRIPFIARWPGVTPAGSRCPGLVGQVDLFATMAEALGARLPDTAAEDSSSMLALLRGQPAPASRRDALVHHSVDGEFSIRQGNWKLILAPGSGGWSPPRRTPSEWSKAKPENLDLLPPFQLYDLAQDPKETTNLAGSHPEVVQRLGRLMRVTIERGRSTPGQDQPYVEGDWPQTQWRKAFQAGAPPKRPVDYVDPRIDTHQTRWIFFASASRPFGMVSLSPDTRLDGDWGAGYIYVEPYIRAFSHIHDWQLAGVPVMPVVGRMNGHEGYEAYKAPFSHEREIVRAGYHKVVLDHSGITAELTSTARVGFHRYAFPATQDAYVLLDIGAPIAMTKMADASIRRTSPRQLAGYSTMAPTVRREKPCTVYFVVDFDRDVAEFGGWEKTPAGKAVRPNVDRVAGPDSGGFVRFRFSEPGQVLMKVAISYVSEENARRNLEAELPGWDFDGTVRASADDWNAWLSTFDVSGGAEQQRVKFYTDLWHALLGRRTFSDADGRYVDNTGTQPRIRRVPLDTDGRPTRATFNSDSFWGSHWNLNVLWSFAYPRMMSEQVSSLVDYYTNGGMTARGPAGGSDSFVMIGDQATPLIAAAYSKGIRDFDVQAAYAGARKNAFPGGIRDRAGYEFGPDPQGGGMKEYVERGWIRATPGGRGFHRAGAAQTLEYAYQDWCLAQFAKALGKDADYDLFLKRASNWKNLFDPSVGWIRPRNDDGTWLEPFTPTCQGGACPGFVESNSAIYTYFVPHDVPGLVDAIGGPARFVEKLGRQFELAAPKQFVTPHGKHAEEWVDYENQPSCHMAHLFTYAGAPWLTQYWVRRVKEEAYGGTTPFSGYNGDEDQGQMGGIGVLMAIGLFDVTGGAGPDPRYEITSPLFDRVTVTLDPRYFGGKTFTIETRGNEPGNIYIQSARLNGRPLTGRFWITHRELTSGGTLEITLGPQPNKAWGIVPSTSVRPYVLQPTRLCQTGRAKGLQSRS